MAVYVPRWMQNDAQKNENEAGGGSAKSAKSSSSTPAVVTLDETTPDIGGVATNTPEPATDAVTGGCTVSPSRAHQWHRLTSGVVKCLSCLRTPEAANDPTPPTPGCEHLFLDAEDFCLDCGESCPATSAKPASVPATASYSTLTAQELLDGLHGLGCHVTVVGDKLCVEDPQQAITVALSATIASRKPDLMAVLQGVRPQPLTPGTPCTVCGATNRWDDRGVWRCKACWPVSVLDDFTIIKTKPVTTEQTLPCPGHGRQQLRIDALGWVVCEVQDCVWSAPWRPAKPGKASSSIKREVPPIACPCGATETVASEPFDDGSVLYRCVGCQKPRQPRHAQPAAIEAA
jgi:hypothetical protein